MTTDTQPDLDGREPPVDEPPHDTRRDLLVIDHVRVSFETVVAVRDATFRLQAGSLLGLVGPNGAGKTTLLRAVAGLQPVDRGRVEIVGQKLDPEMPETFRHIGFTADNPGVYNDLTVRQFLRFIAGAYDLGRRETDERIDFWLEQVWLTEKADQKIQALSRGMRQRIGIARTLLPNPTVILLDEPAAGLDPAGRVQFRQLLVKLRDQGKVLIVSSHILADLDQYCTHIAIMAHGSIVRFGSVAEVTNGSHDQRCRYAIGLAAPVPGLLGILKDIQGVTGVDVAGDRATVEFGRSAEDAAALLNVLVRKKGLPIASFSPLAPGLEEAYMRAGIGQVD